MMMTAYISMSGLDLDALLRAGDEAAYAELYRRYAFMYPSLITSSCV